MMVKMISLLITFSMLIGAKYTFGFHITNIEVPEVADFRESVSLTCSYDLGTRKLNSVKWYKGPKEFFRYAPMYYPPITNFTEIGITLAQEEHKCDRFSCSITLKDLEARSSGTYKCEISADAPQFEQISKSANMTIAALPQFDPWINGIEPNYIYGQFVKANCTSDRSSLATKLSWYINGEKAPHNYIISQDKTTVKIGEYLIKAITSEIRFRVNPFNFPHVPDTIKLKCVASIEAFPKQTRQRIVMLYITDPVLKNEKLINGFSSASYCQLSSYIHLLNSIVLIYKIYTLHCS